MKLHSKLPSQQPTVSDTNVQTSSTGEVLDLRADEGGLGALQEQDSIQTLDAAMQRSVQLAGTHVPDIASQSTLGPSQRAGALQSTHALGLLQQVARVEQDQQNSSNVFAAIDMGSNSAKMLILRQQPDGSMEVVRDHRIGTRLGKDVGVGDPLPEANQERAMDALEEFLDEAAAFGIEPEEIALISTAAVRNSSNGEQFIQRLQTELGLAKASVLTGEEEAEIGYLGTLAAVRNEPGVEASARFATLDLGGGSFQLAVGTRDTMEEGKSTQIGSNYILDEVFPQDATTLSNSDFERVDQILEEVAPMPLETSMLEGRSLVATGGVSKFLKAHFQNGTVTREEIDALRRKAGAIPESERMGLVQEGKDVVAQRALGIDTKEGALDFGKKLPASASLLLHIMDSLGLETVTVSTTDARHALIQQLG